MQIALGKITVAAGGTPTRATVNLPDPTADVVIQSIAFQALPGNTGVVYIFKGGANFTGDHRADLDLCVGILSKPSSATTGPFASASYSAPNVPAGLSAIGDYWIDVSANGDGVIATAIAP